MASASTIPYQLRPHKAIERNLFISVLKKLDRCSKIDIHEYSYVGFGAPFLEDFKSLHLEFGISNMDCVEYNAFAYSRQKFNNPYYFVKLHNLSCTEFIGSKFKQNVNQIIWWDFAEPAEFRQQLIDIELTASKIGNRDILKFTFNAQESSFVLSNHIGCEPHDYKKIISFLKRDATYQKYIPDTISPKDIIDDFSILLRAMALRAVKRGLSNSDKGYTFNHLVSFRYADKQMMTTITGIVTSKEGFQEIFNESGLKKWEFYQGTHNSDYIPSIMIRVPVMTIMERLEIDKNVPSRDIDRLAKKLKFYLGEDAKEHLDLLKGYCKYYKYLPYYSRVTY